MLRIAIATEPSAGANAAAVAAGALALSLAAAARPFARCAGACYCELAIRSSVLCTRATACFKTMTVRVLSSLLQRSHRCHLFFFFRWNFLAHCLPALPVVEACRATR